jgi:hypothetical protein
MKSHDAIIAGTDWLVNLRAMQLSYDLPTELTAKRVL